MQVLMLYKSALWVYDSLCLSVLSIGRNGMHTQGLVAEEPRHARLAPGTRRYHLSSHQQDYVQAKQQDFGGMALMVVDLHHTTNRAVIEHCRRIITSSTVDGWKRRLNVGEVLVRNGVLNGVLQLTFHPYIGGLLQPEGLLIPTAELGRIKRIVG